jgi:hypothetical protein
MVAPSPTVEQVSPPSVLVLVLVLVLPLVLVFGHGCAGDMPPHGPDGGGGTRTEGGTLPDGIDLGSSLEAGSSVDGAGGSSTTCTASGVIFTTSTALVACGKVTIDVNSKTSYTWVMIGITPSGGSTTWRGSATNIGCGGTYCAWTFSDCTVPCQSGPYTLSFMKNATNDDSSKGTVVASCTPK